MGVNGHRRVVITGLGAVTLWGAKTRYLPREIIDLQAGR
jgi:hypothetical protein